MVGCVIVKNGKVIGEAYHQTFGGPHAEPNALANCTESPQGATAYVTLEPCCHTNKKTAPCTPVLIKAQIARVVVGCLDPNPDVDGKGLQQLRAAGIEVTGPVLKNEAKQLIAPFLSWVNTRHPYVTLKWAQTANGKVAGPGGKRLQISCAKSMQIVHELRARCDAIMVGINTVIADNPMLRARNVKTTRPLRRIVLDTDLRIPIESQLVQTSKSDTVTIFCSQEAYQEQVEKVQLLRQHEVQLEMFKRVGSEVGLPLGRVLEKCHNASHLLVEAGPTLARQFFKNEQADRLWIFRSPMMLNDDSAPSAAIIPDHYLKTGELQVDGDILTEYLNPKSDSFFTAEPSADFILARDAGVLPAL
jgi:diaminohydroxyphosphoribosylaminopyrimidine deaminase/5-amino-6-(5-phosphoribosylamino)uracil reductase